MASQSLMVEDPDVAIPDPTPIQAVIVGEPVASTVDIFNISSPDEDAIIDVDAMHAEAHEAERSL